MAIFGCTRYVFGYIRQLSSCQKNRIDLVTDLTWFHDSFIKYSVKSFDLTLDLIRTVRQKKVYSLIQRVINNSYLIKVFLE